MDKQEMLTKIYEIIADKTLSFGCKIELIQNRSPISVQIAGGQTVGYLVKVTTPRNFGLSKPFKDYYVKTPLKQEVFDWADKYCKIIGHPVMIGDVLDWICKNRRGFSDVHNNQEQIDCVFIWKNKRQPIDTQSEDCIKCVYDLLPPSSSNE